MKSAIILNKNLTANRIIFKKLKPKIRSYSDEATDFHTREIPDPGYNCICWSVYLTDSFFK